MMMALILKQIFGSGREAVGEILGIVDPLDVNLVFRGAKHGRHLHDLVVVFGAPDELVLPARFAFHVQDAALVGHDVDQARDGVVGAILFVRQADRAKTETTWRLRRPR